MLETCYTILNSLVVDWQATQYLFSRYGPAWELNPLARLVGPDAYFLPIVTVAADRCADWPTWVAAAVWAVQTWAVNTHTVLGTVVSYPQLLIVWRW